MLIPSRAFEKGRQGFADSAPSALKPQSVIAQSVSMPPTIAASMSPAPMSRCPVASGFALEVHAVDTTQPGP